MTDVTENSIEGLLINDAASEKMTDQDKAQSTDKTGKTEDLEDLIKIKNKTSFKNLASPFQGSPEISKAKEEYQEFLRLREKVQTTMPINKLRRRAELWRWWDCTQILRTKTCTNCFRPRELCRNVWLSRTISEEAWQRQLWSITTRHQQRVR